MDETRITPAIGEEAPNFTLAAAIADRESSITLSQYRGSKIVVLAFYVLDWTGG